MALSCQQSSHERSEVFLFAPTNYSSASSCHHALEAFRPFLVKVTGAAQSDFGLVQLQVDRKLLLNWINLGVQRNRLCHIEGLVKLMQPNFPLQPIEQTRNVTLGSWQHGVWASGLFHWLQLWMCEVRHHCQLFQPCRVL